MQGTASSQQPPILHPHTQFYYLFGFLTLVFIILLITCAEITIVLCYFQLCSEDYRWWWRAYFTSGSSALYLFAYSVFYFYSKLDITKTVPMLMYFGECPCVLLFCTCSFVWFITKAVPMLMSLVRGSHWGTS